MTMDYAGEDTTKHGQGATNKLGIDQKRGNGN